MNEHRQRLWKELQNLPPPTWIEGPQFPQEIIDEVNKEREKKRQERLAQEAKEKDGKPEK